MSSDVKGGLDYALLKRHYDNDDYVSLRHPVTNAVLLNGIPFTDEETYYVVGFMAYLNDPTIIGTALAPKPSWTTYTHEQAAAPLWLVAPPPAAPQPLQIIAPFLTGDLRTTVQKWLEEWPTGLPAFEAKDLLFRSDKDCWIRFAGPKRVQHFIPANNYVRFHRRCFIFYVVQDSTEGTLKVWMEG